MKTLQVPFAFHPDPVGGTEVYVEALARELVAREVDAVIVAPGAAAGAYAHRGLPVRRFTGGSGRLDLAHLYGDGDPVAAAAFARLLDEERPDLVHFHAFTPAVSVRAVREARARRLPVVFTYHTPTVSCLRGTLLRWGGEVCDGVLDVRRCAGCVLDGLGLGRVGGAALGLVPPSLGRALATAGLGGGAWTALRMSALVASRHRAIGELLAAVDRVVVLCRWTEALLARNGVPAAKVVVCPHGLPRSASGPSARPDPPPAEAGSPGPLRVAYLGRLDPTKGPDLLIRAVRALPGLAIRLDLFGVVQGGHLTRYGAELARLAAGDGRVAFRAPVEHEAVVTLLRGYDLVAVPSRWLETGPLVVLEAFAAGTPVVGSALGGIAEKVRHGVDGLLVEPESEPAWRETLARLAADRALVARLRAGVRPPRRMRDVAAEMAGLYRALVPGSAAAPALARVTDQAIAPPAGRPSVAGPAARRAGGGR